MDLDGKIFFTHSRIGVVDSIESKAYSGKYPLVCLKDERRFSVLDLGDGIPREYDTEAKFLEYVADVKVKNLEEAFTVTILSEKHICESCQNVVKQFQKMFPKSTVNIISGKKGYNGSEKGLLTWKYRNKVK